jgi:hypothetical protein
MNASKTNKKLSVAITLVGIAAFSLLLNSSCSTELEPSEGSRAVRGSSTDSNNPDGSNFENQACQIARQGADRGITRPFGGWSDFTSDYLILNELDGDAHAPIVELEDINNPTHLIVDFLDRRPDSQLCVTWTINGFLQDGTSGCFGIRVRNNPDYPDFGEDTQEYFARVEILPEADGAEFFFEETEACFSGPFL